MNKYEIQYASLALSLAPQSHRCVLHISVHVQVLRQNNAHNPTARCCAAAVSGESVSVHRRMPVIIYEKYEIE